MQLKYDYNAYIVVRTFFSTERELKKNVWIGDSRGEHFFIYLNEIIPSNASQDFPSQLISSTPKHYPTSADKQSEYVYANCFFFKECPTSIRLNSQCITISTLTKFVYKSHRTEVSRLLLIQLATCTEQ